ncbi:Transposase IS116/IS110/IS902 family protein [Salegentibacter flavus]|uniref:Transposase IS116/IS110/IS902 family protein n=1 Tax=Salegentibacter flavus TaxID=287099 RepID=A0A1I5C441_9FLAO|nr:Transposase IS116/IS110/IS902 family protein [Salegentibacter flavus]
MIFIKFENARQLFCYPEITLIIRESGSSVRVESRISKTGNPNLRDLLFMCSFTACKIIRLVEISMKE